MSTATDINLMDLAPFIEGRDAEQFRKLREDDPLHWTDEPQGPGFWSVTRYADVIATIEEPVTFVNGKGTQIPSRKVEGNTPTVHNTDPPRHSQLRRIAAPHLRAVKVKEWQDIIDHNVDEILDNIEGKRDVEFVESAAALLPIRVLGQVLGVPHEDCGLLYDWTNKFISDDPEYLKEPGDRERAREDLFAYFEDLSAQRRKSPQHDLASVLVAARIDGEPLSGEDLAAYYFVLVGAGNETTRNLITGSMLAFDRFPEEWEKLRADRSLVRPAVEELVRYVTPIRAMRRTATQDVEMHGKTIREGDKLVLWFAAANRDASVFDDPETVRIDRSPNDHVGFGWGIHSCMGSHLARAEANTFIQRLLERDLRVRPLAEPERLHTNQFNAFKRLRVDITPA